MKQQRQKAMKIAMRPKEVPNPRYLPAHDGEKWNPRTVVAVVNIRESAVASLEARGQLDRTQVAAADRFRGLWERMGGAGAKAIDYTKEPVDGGGVRETLSEKMVSAGKELARCRSLLGVRNYRLVSAVCGEGMSFKEIGAQTRRERDTAADNLRDSLDDLARMWGFSNVIG